MSRNEAAKGRGDTQAASFSSDQWDGWVQYIQVTIAMDAVWIDGH